MKYHIILILLFADSPIAYFGQSDGVNNTITPLILSEYNDDAVCAKYANCCSLFFGILNKFSKF